MGIRARRGKWHYRFHLGGHDWSGSTDLSATERNHGKALRVEAEARRLILAGRSLELRVQPKPFIDAARAYMTWCDGEYRDHPESARRIRVSFTSLMAHFGGAPVSGISAGVIEDYKAFRRSNGVKEVTIRHDLHALSGFMQYAMKHGWCAANVVRDVEMPSDAEAVRIHVLSAAEEQAYFAACLERWGTGKRKHGPFPDLHDMARITLEQGMRPDDEVLAMEWANVDLVRGRVVVPRGKSAAARRTLRLTDVSRAILAARRPSSGLGRWVFPGKTPGQHLVKLNNSHDLVLAHAGLAFVLYDLRHTFATRMANAGCPLPTLQRILGHASLRTIQRYVHPSQTDMDAAMERYARSDFGPTLASQRGYLGESGGKAN